MSDYYKQSRQETIVYTIVWILLFLSPLASLFSHYDDTPAQEAQVMNSLIDTWASMLTFFIVFLIHNHLLAPMLVKNKRVKQYVIATIAVVALFQVAHCAHKPNGSPLLKVTSQEAAAPPPEGFKRFGPNGRPPIDRHDLSVFMIVIMMLGCNLGVKSHFQNEEEKRHLAKLKEQSLKQELEYLRYQINPHFIMNTLNNIHALVDIDPEQAKDSIVDMSKMMRYLLYESDNHCVSLSSAILFLKKYLNLMKLRYMDTVNINLDVPEHCSEDVALGPLVFIPFVENAFKHGVSIDKTSTIDIDIKHKDGRLLFHCHNTKSHAKHEYGGVGLNNVTKRLELIYGNDYCLDIHDEDESYDVLLNLPAKCPGDFSDSTQPQLMSNA